MKTIINHETNTVTFKGNLSLSTFEQIKEESGFFTFLVTPVTPSIVPTYSSFLRDTKRSLDARILSGLDCSQELRDYVTLKDSIVIIRKCEKCPLQTEYIARIFGNNRHKEVSWHGINTYVNAIVLAGFNTDNAPYLNCFLREIAKYSSANLYRCANSPIIHKCALIWNLNFEASSVFHCLMRGLDMGLETMEGMKAYFIDESVYADFVNPFPEDRGGEIAIEYPEGEGE